MTGHFILADMTSHRRGFGVQPIIDATARRAKQLKDPARVLWLVPSHLASSFPSGLEVQVCDTLGPLLWKTVEEGIAEAKATSPGVEIVIATWDQFVWERARSFGSGVAAVKWVNWLEEDQVLRIRRRPCRPLNYASQHHLWRSWLSWCFDIFAQSTQRRREVLSTAVNFVPDLLRRSRS